MIREIQKLLDEYQTWLKAQTRLRELNDWVEISTPYLDRHNDYLQIYVGRENGNYLLTDDGYILSDLALSGCEINTEKRKAIFTNTINGFGIKLENNRLQVTTDEKNFSMSKHNLLQAMLAVNDLFCMAAPLVKSLFLEDVENWLDIKNIRYSPRIKIAGKSGFDHNFDFLIAHYMSQPERILKAIPKPSRESATSLAFSWLDIKDSRSQNTKMFAFLNDSEEPINTEINNALRNYEINPIVWSKREEFAEILAA